MAKSPTVLKGTEVGKPPVLAPAKPYLIPFSVAAKALGLSTSDIPNEFKVTKTQFQKFLTIILRGVPVDDQWYRAAYPDIAQAITREEQVSAKDHFVEHGYVEGRRPGAVKVDEEWYMREYPDIAAAIKAGKNGSCQEHFDNFGQAEGRLPFRS